MLAVQTKGRMSTTKCRVCGVHLITPLERVNGYCTRHNEMRQIAGRALASGRIEVLPQKAAGEVRRKRVLMGY